MDLKGIRNVWSFIRPAGTATLTCYLVPYVYYAIVAVLGLALPEFLNEGYIGLIKSMIYALLIVWITGLIGRMNIKLKI